MTRTDARPAEWLPRPWAILAIAVTAAALVVHAGVGFQGAYLAYGSGVWLTLARDVSEGVFVRGLIGDAGYGGTRYFPVFFTLIGALAAIGIPIVAAGWLVATAALGWLAAALYRAMRGLEAPPLTAAVFAAAGAGSYFAQQTTFEIRADVLAAAFNVWGVALLLPSWMRHQSAIRVPAGLAALCFTLAFGTKVTSLSVPAALLVLALVTGRAPLARTLAWRLVAGVTAAMVLFHVASNGRAWDVWATVMFAGAGAGATFAGVSPGSLVGVFRASRLLTALAVAAGTVAAAAWGMREERGLIGRRWWLPVGLWVTATATVALVLASPGTVPANQVVEWIALTVLVVGMSAAWSCRVRRAAAGLMAGFVVWMAAQNVTHAATQARLWSRDGRVVEARIVERLRALPPPVLAESALWPILSGREVVMPDAFASRVVHKARSDIEAHLVARLESREFSAVILEFDPDSVEGRGVYAHLHFGETVLAAIRRNYRLDERIAGRAFVYVPRR